MILKNRNIVLKDIKPSMTVATSSAMFKTLNPIKLNYAKQQTTSQHTSDPLKITNEFLCRRLLLGIA